jgi:hypothetical protein
MGLTSHLPVDVFVTMCEDSGKALARLNMTHNYVTILV